jgi:hypothetical protein
LWCMKDYKLDDRNVDYEQTMFYQGVQRWDNGELDGLYSWLCLELIGEVIQPRTSRIFVLCNRQWIGQWESEFVYLPN